MDHGLGEHSRFTLKETVSVVLLGTAGGVMTALQPLFLGAMVQEGRLSTVQLGRAATSELIAMAIVSGLAGGWLKPHRLRPIGFAVVAAAALFNLMTMEASGNAIILVRFFSGCCSGLLLWFLTSMVARIALPARLVGLYASGQSILALLLVRACSSYLLPHFGPQGAYGSLAAVNLLVLIPVCFIPKAYTALQHKGAGGLPGPRGLFGLGSCFAYLGAVIGLWVYILPLAKQLGQSPDIVELALSVGIVCQILGGLAAAILAARINYLAALAGCGLAGLLAIATINAGVSGPLFAMAIAVFGFVWMFSPPFQMPLLLVADPTRRAAMLITSAQLLGCAAGPLLASLVVSEGDVRGAMTVSAALFSISTALALGVAFAASDRVRNLRRVSRV